MTQKDLTQFDKALARKCEEYEDKLFDREARRAILSKMDPPRSTIIASLIEAAKKRDQKIAKMNRIRKWFNKSNSWLGERVSH